MFLEMAAGRQAFKGLVAYLAYDEVYVSGTRPFQPVIFLFRPGFLPLIGLAPFA